MTPQKRILVARRGLIKLSPQVKELRRKMIVLDKAVVKLHNMHHKAQLEIIPVRNIPMGRSAESKSTEEKKVNSAISKVPTNKISELVSLLEQKLKGGEQNDYLRTTTG